MKRGHLVILLVEDDENDVFLLHKATQVGGEGHTVRAVHDGIEAIDYLKGSGGFQDRNRFPLPNVILSDLKMPRMNGFELLEWVRANSHYSVIPAIIYSSSRLEKDVRRAYQLGANSYITKPGNLVEMIDILRIIYDYWSRCECPSLRE